MDPGFMGIEFALCFHLMNRGCSVTVYGRVICLHSVGGVVLAAGPGGGQWDCLMR
jgi:hypothetical protein